MEFIKPDFDEPLDLEPLLRGCRNEHRLKGVFFDSSQKGAARLGLATSPKRYMAFKDYPSEEYVRVVGGWVTAPGLPRTPRALLRALGQDAFQAFRSTIVGRVTLATAGDTLHDLLNVAGRAYSLSIGPGTLTSRVGENDAELQLRNIPTFADAYHVGVFEGVLAAYRTKGTIRMRRYSPVNLDLLIEWE